MFPSLSKLNRGINIIDANTKESWTTQGLLKVPTTDKLTQFNLTRGLMERPWERDLLCLLGMKREIYLPQKDFSFLFLPEKKFQPPWIYLSDTMTKRFLTVPTKEPPPLSLETSLRGDHLCPSCPLFLTPGGTAASAATHPPGLFPHLLPHPPHHPINKHQVAIGDRTHT